MKLLRALDHHWFAPASLTELAIVRIAVVGAQLLWFLPDREHQRWLASVPADQFFPLPALKVLLLPGGWGVRPEAWLVDAVWTAALVSGAFALTGLLTRVSLPIFALANTLLVAHEYSYREFHHPEALMIIALGVLALGPAGARLSLDRWLFARGRGAGESDLSPMGRWPVRLIQWLFVLVYLSAGMSKLAYGGLQWFNGYTLAFYIAEDTLRHDPPLGAFALAQPRLVLSALSVFAVAFELTFAIAILLPRAVWLYVLSGIALHVGIYLVQSAPFFQYLVLYVVFIESLRQSVRAVPGWAAGRGLRAGARGAARG